MKIDSSAGTMLTYFDGNFNEIDYLKYDVTNLAHYINRNAKVMVVGTGGGRDILSALIFNQKTVLGVEINKNIIDAVNQKFGDFTGHLDKNPKVTFVHDEARSYIIRSNETFDIIQVSLIDTWAATAAGAYVLTENALYTVEAWKSFLQHLNPNGILTFSRWYFKDRPGEVYRLTSLASASLKQIGIKNPRGNIVIVRKTPYWNTTDERNGIGTILVKREPFSDEDLDTIETIVRQMKFDMILSPRFSWDSTFATLASGKDLDKFTASYPVNIAAPTDDNPFFFNMLRLRDLLNRNLREQGIMSFNMKAVYILAVLLIVVIGLTSLCIIFPLLLSTKLSVLKGNGPLFIFFSCIGLGFMLLEISQMQRFIIFLGRPTYSLSIVLSSLLLSGGIGSYTTQKIGKFEFTKSACIRLIFLLSVLIVFGIVTPFAIRISQGAITLLRTAVTIGILFPLGLFMGTAFPIGMKLASTKLANITPWLWGINGAMSVSASVLAVAISLSFGISITYWTGVFCYAIAFIAFIQTSRAKYPASKFL